MTPLDAHEEAKLLDAVKRAADLVEDGSAPDDAVCKVATDMQLTPGRIRAVCYAYNTGRQTCQRESEDSALGKFAAFPLADPDQVIRRVYAEPERRKEASAQADVCDDYSRPPDWLDLPERAKIAASALHYPDKPPEPYRPDPLEAMKKAYGAVEREKRAAEELRRQASCLEDELRAHMAGLVGYFKKFAYDRLSFATAEQAAHTYFGGGSRPLLDYVYAQARCTEKRAGDSLDVLQAPVDLRAEPFAGMARCLKLAGDLRAARAATEAARTKAAAAEEGLLRPFGQAAPSPRPLSASIVSSAGAGEVKRAAGLMGQPAIGAAVGTMLSRSLGDMPKPRDSLVDDVWSELDDPAHQNELRKIRAHTMLTSMLTDPDDPISGHDPDRVLREYNEISQMAPNLADQPAALRSVLQRRLQGHVQPFEAKEITDIEKAISQSRLARGGGGRNESLLG